MTGFFFTLTRDCVLLCETKSGFVRSARMDPNKTALERAFEHAESGRCLDITDVKRRLHIEGYSLDALEGPKLVAQLKLKILEAARTSPYVRPADGIGAD